MRPATLPARPCSGQTAKPGFTTGTPWFYINENYKNINVEQALNDPDSIPDFLQKAIALRKSPAVERDEGYQGVMGGVKLFVSTHAKQRSKKLLVICSFTDKPVRFQAPYNFSLSDMKLLLTNYDDTCEENSFLTRPYEARVCIFMNEEFL